MKPRKGVDSVINLCIPFNYGDAICLTKEVTVNGKLYKKGTSGTIVTSPLTGADNKEWTVWLYDNQQDVSSSAVGSVVNLATSDFAVTYIPTKHKLVKIPIREAVLLPYVTYDALKTKQQEELSRSSTHTYNEEFFTIAKYISVYILIDLIQEGLAQVESENRDATILAVSDAFMQKTKLAYQFDMGQ